MRMNEQWYKLPDSRELAAQYLLLYEMSLPYGLDLNDQINIDKSGVRIIASMNPMSSNQIMEMEARANNWMKQNLKGYKVEQASASLMFAHIGKRNIGQMLIGSLLAFVLISTLLMFAFKSIKVRG